MPKLLGLTISIGVLAGVATWLAVSDITGLGLQIWAVFIAWACFFQCGGGERGFVTTVIATAFGVLIGAAALYLNGNFNPGIADAVWAGVAVGIGAAVIVLASSIPLFAAIPASVLGFASIAAYALLSSGANDITSVALDGPILTVIISLIVGAVFGYVSEKLAGILSAG